jgi:hypothetical protein
MPSPSVLDLFGPSSAFFIAGYRCNISDYAYSISCEIESTDGQLDRM